MKFNINIIPQKHILGHLNGVSGSGNIVLNVIHNAVTFDLAQSDLGDLNLIHNFKILTEKLILLHKTLLLNVF